MIDRLFFRKKFDYKGTVLSVSNALSSLLNQKTIIETLVSTVREGMFVDMAGVILPNVNQGGLALYGSGVTGRELSNSELHVASFPSDDSLFSLVFQERKLVTKYDIAELPYYENVKDTCGKRFSELGANMLVPMIHQNEVRGAMVLGNKKSGHLYTREDIDLLETLANQGAVALANAGLADQMKKDEGVRTNLARYLSPQIVDKIIEQDVQVNLGGERKIVTVLFSDIRNFTTITESRRPDQLVAILNEYFTEMATIIFKYKGSLDKYIGDAIVAVFGSLIPLENSGLHATRAAVAMIKRMPDLNARWQREYGFGMDIGIGVNTGEVFLGNIGSPERMEFTVIGDTVNVASRFSGLAKGGQILLTREAFSGLGRSIPHQQLPSAQVKGKAEELEVFEVLHDSF